MHPMDDSAVVTPPHIGKPLRLEPFRGLTLAPRWIGGPSALRAFARPYRDVADRIVAWEARGRVTADDSAAVYLHEYTVGDRTVRGLVGLLRLDHRARRHADRALLPHEGVHPGQVADLAVRMYEMGMNPAPILLVHRGPSEVRELARRIRGEPAGRSFSDRSGNPHSIWAIRDPADQAALAEGLADCTPVIADGHHRYAAYLSLQEQRPGTEWDRGLAMLVDQDDTPLVLGAIHRTLPGLTIGDVTGACALALPRVTARVLAGPDALAAIGPATVAVTDGTDWVVVDLPVPVGTALVEVWQADVVPALPGRRRKAAYHHRVEDALAELERRPGVAVLLPAPGYDLVHDLVAADRLMPEKATSFGPKPALGVLMRAVRDG